MPCLTYGNLTVYRSKGRWKYLYETAVKWCAGCHKFLVHRAKWFVDSSGWPR